MGGFQNTIFRPPNAAQLSAQERHLTAPPPDARENPPSPAPIFRIPWYREKALAEHRLFTKAEVLNKQGLSLEKALRRRWHGPHFHSAHHIKARIGTSRLRARFYHWQRNGRTPECLRMRFASMLPAVPPEIVRAFVDACAVAGVHRYSTAFRLVDLKGFSCRRVFSALSDRSRRIVRETFEARRQAEIEYRKLLREFQGQMCRQLAADAARSRRVKRLAEGLV